MLDARRETALSEFRRLLTETAEPTYCGTIGVEAVVHMGEIRTVRLPQMHSIPLPPHEADEKHSKPRAV